jgi:hypothetical protein
MQDSAGTTWQTKPTKPTMASECLSMRAAHALISALLWTAVDNRCHHR